ncbi:MAG TPA: cysteine dioxygenase family protein [Acidimicrobiales bacterium]
MTIARDPVIRTTGAITVTGGVTADLARHPANARTADQRTARRPARRVSLDPIALLDLAKEHASATGAWAEQDTASLTERSYELVSLTDDVEVWVIHWPAGGSLQLHDHGGSSGAFWVVGGTLEERYLTDDRSLAHRRIGAASGAGFGARYVHDVRNGGTAPATSVHAYSPPMPGMTFYRTSPTGLVAERTEYRSDPSWAP